ncbi:hypothetical protein LCGC14_2294250 [marine sediment metagenome]|uniref:Uncharacterized protein n=1 Tax=marine sediment metagenome TaxID=412755 RepID=A0A0F9FKF4_9ZZZZ
MLGGTAIQASTQEQLRAAGMTVTNDGTKTTFLGKTGDYTRIGDANTTSHSFASEDDLVVTGKLEVNSVAWFDENVTFTFKTTHRDDIKSGFGASDDAIMIYETADINARVMMFMMDESDDSGDNVPAWVFGEETNLTNADLGLLDEVVQPHLVVVENAGKFVNITNATSVGASITLTTATGNTFDDAIVGDLVRVTAGTNATVGWYFIDAATDGTNIDLDRNWCTGAVTGGNVQIWHKVVMMTPKAIYLPIYDAAPADSDLDIDRDGAMALEVTQANGRLYWRANNGWHYVDATAGLSLPADERVDTNGHEFQLGETVKLVIDRINDDGSFHAMPVFGGV